MSSDSIDPRRRKFLLGATTVVAGAGMAAAAVPFITSMLPNAAARAAGGPVKVKIGEMKAGDQLTVIWRGKPIWIVRRNEAMLTQLLTLDAQLSDPQSKIEQQPAYAQNSYRSINPKFLVLVGICTHLGCSPTYRPEPGSIDDHWPGGFFCSCHGSKFDLAGRVFKSVPAPTNLEVPPYAFINDNEIIIGKTQV